MSDWKTEQRRWLDEKFPEFVDAMTREVVTHVTLAAGGKRGA